MLNWHTVFDGNAYNDPRDELRARGERAKSVKDRYVAVPVDLIEAVLEVKTCSATTLVAGERESRTKIQIRCERIEHGRDGHRSGRITWDG